MNEARRIHWLSIACAACAGVPALLWVASALWKMTFAILGRDQGIFQYVAWALLKGERDYVDFREINGPLIHFIHILFLKAGGADEHRFRLLDVLLSSAVFFAVGALMPGISKEKPDDGVSPDWRERVVWGLAGWVILGAQYVAHDWWQTGQRESLYNLFLLASIALQLYATAPSSQPRRRLAFLGLAGFLSALTWFGKPTCLLYTALQGAVLFWNGDERSVRRPRLAYFVIGTVGASAVMMVSLAAIGSPSRAAHIILLEVPRLYRYIWKRSLYDCYIAWNNGPKLDYAFVTLLVAIVGAWLSRAPKRFYATFILLAGGLFTFFFQGKGFPYHLHPITAGTHLLWLALLVHVSERAVDAKRAARRVHTGALVGAALAIGGLCLDRAYHSESARSDWNVSGATPELRRGESFVKQFPWDDFFAWDLRRAAEYIRGVTSPNERIQTYGMDPYILFLAERLSATPYIYSFELNVDGALKGGSGGKPGQEERRWLERTAAEHSEEWLAALKANSPAAFVLIDHAPFTYPDDAEEDLEEHCPAVWEWLRAGFVPAARFGAVRIWLPRDRAVPDPAAP